MVRKYRKILKINTAILINIRSATPRWRGARDGYGSQGKTKITACGDGNKIITRRRRRLTKLIVPPADDTAVGLQGKTMLITCGLRQTVLVCFLSVLFVDFFVKQSLFVGKHILLNKGLNFLQVGIFALAGG
jgi:hypothetical protein